MGDDSFASLPAMGHCTARPKLERAASSRQLHHATGYEPVIREYEGENSMSLLRRTAVVLGTFGLLAFAGCAGVATEGANIAKDKVVASNNLAAAQAGNAEAQYKVGKAMCCSLNEGGQGFYDTPQSVGWLCKAAAQNHGQAALKLGEIYSGDVVSGVRVLRRVAQKVAGSSTERAVAYAWMRRAETLGAKDAQKSASDLWADLAATERAEASAMVTGRKSLLCDWRDVIPGS